MSPRWRGAKVAVLGGGSWGTAVAHLLGVAGNEVWLWMRDEKVRDQVNREHKNDDYMPGFPIDARVRATSDLREAAGGAPLVYVVVPSSAIRKVAYDLGNFVSGDQVLVSCTKGLEPETRKRMSEVLKEETCVKKVAVLSGPNLYKEIMKGQPAATVVASRFADAIELATASIMSPYFRVYGNDDVIGVELAGAMKNIIAIASGIASGLQFGDNTKAMVITRGLAEITRISVRLGANPLTFAGLAGVGDLMATCASPLSRNYTVGFRLAQGESLEAITGSMNQVAEGINTARVVHELAKDLDVVMPITEGVYRCLYERVPPLQALRELMARQAVYEIDRAVQLQPA